jgi:Protein of unknown function (DUF2924)
MDLSHRASKLCEVDADFSRGRLIMPPRNVDPVEIEAEVTQIRSLDIDALRRRWRMMFGAIPPKGLSKDIIGRMIAYRIQEEAFGGLDRETMKLLDRLSRGEKTNDLNRPLKSGTIPIREYCGERHTVTVVPDGFLWQDATYPSLSAIAQAITGTKWNGPRFFGLRVSKKRNEPEVDQQEPREQKSLRDIHPPGHATELKRSGSSRRG